MTWPDISERSYAVPASPGAGIPSRRWASSASGFAAGSKRQPLLRGSSVYDYQLLKSTLEAGMGIEPINGGFANHCLTGWLPRRARWRVAKQLGQRRAGVKPWIAGLSEKARTGMRVKLRR
jgi:hypothetical protein